MIETNLLECGGQSLTRYGIPLNDAQIIHEETTDLIRRHLNNTDLDAERHEADSRIDRLNSDQRQVFGLIEDMCNGNSTSKIMFLGASPGTGKSFLLNTVIAHHRAQGHIVLSTASTANAALLLSQGRTVHSQFKVPLNIHRDSTCNINRGTNLSRLFSQTAIIIIDEVTMLHKYIIEAIDRSLRDILQVTQPFGGIPIVLSGDFKQCLPIIPGKGKEFISASILKRSYIWPSTIKCSLTTSMRLRAGFEYWHSYLESLGTGQLNNSSDDVELKHVRITSSIDDLINHVFPDLYATSLDSVILCPLNASVTSINDKIIEEVPGSSMTYLSVDSSLTEDGQSTYPVEFLNTIDIGCLPPHKLKLKIGTPIIILRNLRYPTMVNGTR